jgi:hypothetical protein
VVLTGQRIAVGVELPDKAPRRLAAALRWSRDGDGDAGVLWLVPAAGVGARLAVAIDRACATAPKAVERLSVELLYTS